MQGENLESTRSEARWLELARRGRLDAYNQLILAYQQLVYNIAFYALGDSGLAAEVTQEAFTDGFCQLARRQDEGFRELVVRLVVARCRKCQRCERGWPYRLQASRPATSGLRCARTSFPDIRQDPERMGNQSVVLGYLQTLNHEERITLVLADVVGFSYAEVAAATGIHDTAIRACLARARRQIQAALLAQQRH